MIPAYAGMTDGEEQEGQMERNRNDRWRGTGMTDGEEQEGQMERNRNDRWRGTGMTDEVRNDKKIFFYKTKKEPI
ncbi:hypothetical protein BKN14_01720 [Candidatus Gracilibacteria bacterium HOT-871]|nr:hypothetical protein BKN14_01720 [Candidatus Gracilibacteria bacterium HOT-871]